MIVICRVCSAAGCRLGCKRTLGSAHSRAALSVAALAVMRRREEEVVQLVLLSLAESARARAQQEHCS
jgi:hypothetical protein